MNINELHEFKFSDTVKFHDKLNPRLWDDDHLDPVVRRQLLIIAADFMEFLGITDLQVEDITLSGSNAAYSYTSYSDIDLHLIVDIDALSNDSVYRELFNSKKLLYNDKHEITVRGINVELYVQDSSQPHYSLGEYSVLRNKWIKYPSRSRRNLDERASKLKFQKLVQLAELALVHGDLDMIRNVVSVIGRYRKSGLEAHGEWGPENIAYKALRGAGYLDRLRDRLDRLRSQQLSIDEASNLPPFSRNRRRPSQFPVVPDQTRRPYTPDTHTPDTHTTTKTPRYYALGRVTGSYTDQQLLAMGCYKTDNGRWMCPVSAREKIKEASGYIPSESERDDPRFKTALTVDVGPQTMKQQAKKLGFTVSREGIPPLLR